MKQQAQRFRQAVLLRARDSYMRSIGRTTLAASLLLAQQMLCVFVASGLSDRLAHLSISIAGYPLNWTFHVTLFALFSLFGPIMLGVTEYFVLQLHTGSGRVINIFSWFGDSDRLWVGIKYGLFQSLLLVIGQLIGEVPSFIFFKNGLSFETITAASNTMDPAAIQYILDHSGIIYLTFATYLLGFAVQIPLLRLAATEYLLVGSPRLKLGAALKESNSLMKGKVGSFLLTILKVLPIIFLMSGCGFLFFLGYGFYYMVRSSFIDTLIISRFMENHGSGGTPEDVIDFSEYLRHSSEEEGDDPSPVIEESDERDDKDKE